MKQILLIDGNPLMWRAACSKGEHNVTEYILKYFFDILEKFPDADVLLFWDEGKSRWRSEFYPEYKAQREVTKQQFDRAEMKRQKDAAMKYLSYFGVRSIVIPGIEADDLIAVFSEYFSKVLQYNQVFICTRDRDLWQLIDDNVLVYDTFSNVIVDSSVVMDKFGTDPIGIASIKALSGDSSDNIKGVSGVGDNKAIKFLDMYGGIEGLLSVDNSKALLKQKISGRIVHNSEDMEISYQLVKLPRLYDISSYLSISDLELLKGQCLSEVVKNPMKAQVEADLLEIQIRSTSKYVSSLDAELKRFTDDWLYDLSISTGMSITELDTAILTCNRCTSRTYDGFIPEAPQGALAADIMVVSRSPNYDRTLVESMLDRLELDSKRIWWTSVSKCQSNVPLTYGKIRCCSSFLSEELSLVKPNLIISLGSEAMVTLTELRGRASKNSGIILQSSVGLIGPVSSYVAILSDPILAMRSEQRMVDWTFGVNKLVEFFEEKRAK